VKLVMVMGKRIRPIEESEEYAAAAADDVPLAALLPHESSDLIAAARQSAASCVRATSAVELLLDGGHRPLTVKERERLRTLLRLEAEAFAHRAAAFDAAALDAPARQHRDHKAG
jgi:hypothetical protein